MPQQDAPKEGLLSDSLPPGWERKQHSDGRTFYVNHNDQTTHWTPPDPRTGGPSAQKMNKNSSTKSLQDGDHNVSGFLNRFASVWILEHKHGFFERMCCPPEIFDVYDGDRSRVLLHGQETSESWQRVWCGKAREYNIHMIDPVSSREIFRLYHPLLCCQFRWGCCGISDDPSCYQETFVYGGRDTSEADQKLGTIREDFACFAQQLTMYNGSGYQEPSFRLVTDCTRACCSCSYDMDIVDARDNQVKSVARKEYGGLLRELSMSNQYHMDFPGNATGDEKALLIASIIFNDMIMEQNQENNNG